MYPEDEHVALPQLFGAPAYARPPLPITPTALPPHPDDLPIAVEQTPEERAIADALVDKPFGVAETPSFTAETTRPPRPHELISMAERLFRRAS